MKAPDQSIGLDDSEDSGGLLSPIVEEVVIGRYRADDPAVPHRTVRRTEVEAGVSQVLTQLKAEAAVEYKVYQAFIDRAVDVFGDELIASRWLSTPSADLDGDVPLQVAQELRYAPARIEEVFEPIFIRIEHGIYS